VAFRTQIIDFSAPELIESHQRVSNSSVMGRQQELYEFMKTIKDNQYNIFFLYGHPGVGKTTFAIKSATYLIERRVFEIYFFIDLFDIKDRDMFRNKFNEVTMLGYPFNKNSIN
jgi:predicted AAA+ superfamily ATPase